MTLCFTPKGIQQVPITSATAVSHEVQQKGDDQINAQGAMAREVRRVTLQPRWFGALKK
jgi:hypothetical protein